MRCICLHPACSPCISMSATRVSNVSSPQNRATWLSLVLFQTRAFTGNTVRSTHELSPVTVTISKLPHLQLRPPHAETTKCMWKLHGEDHHDETGASTSCSQILSEIMSTSLQNRVVYLLETSTMFVDSAARLSALPPSAAPQQSLVETIVVGGGILGMKITCWTTCSTSGCLKNKPHLETTRTCTAGTWCSKSLEACRGTPASGPAASTRDCGRIPPTSSQSNKSKDASWEGRVFHTLTTHFTCSPPPRSWPSSVPVGRCGNCSSKTLRNGHRDHQKGLHLHFVEASVWKNSALRTRVRQR